MGKGVLQYAPTIIMNDFKIKKQIITFLAARGEKHTSGEAMSESLGFSRAYLWKYIGKLRREGFDIEAAPHRGYILKSHPDKLYGYDVGKNTVYHYESIDSTNDKAYELAEAGATEGTIVFAEAQTSGKGRMGRKWVSPPGEGIYMSLILRPDVDVSEISTITLIAALSVTRAIKETCSIEAGIKWPNDIMIDGKKVCGILTEMKAEPDMVDFVVLGMGINVNTDATLLPPGGISLRGVLARRVERVSLVKNILKNFENDYEKFRSNGFAALREECKASSAVLGKRVRVEEHTRSTEGVVSDIDEKGALIIETDDGSFSRMFSGDVVLCREQL